MMQVMKAIVRFQYEFFQTGDFKTLKPMVLRNISELVGLDVSTISRVTSTKYVQTDFGTVHLKELFTEAMSKENGDVVSNKEIQDIIKEMLVNENKSQPLTDQEISEVLREEGYKVARRTVAKYRECIGLPIAKMRRSMV
jgi:RNA polymerase sigma-54 factor